MGNLMLTLMIALLMRDSAGHDWTVTRDKAKDQKSIVVVMESPGSTNASKANRLVINSTYDDSIFISTFLKQGANVTVIQDGKSVVEVEKTADEKLAGLEQSAKEIMSMQNRNVTHRSPEVKKLLEVIRTMQQSSTDKSVLEGLSRIAAALNSRFKNVQSSDDDKKLRNMVKDLERSLNVTLANNKRPNNLENLDKISEMTRALAIRTGDVGLRNYALKIVQAFEIATRPFRKKPGLSGKLAELATRIRKDYFVKENATVLNGYIDQLNKLPTSPKTAENLSLVKSLKREIVDLTEAIETIDTVEDALEAEPEQFETLVRNKSTDRLMSQLRKFSKSARNKRMQTEAEELLSELKVRLEFFAESQKNSANFMTVLDAINRTLIDHNDLGGKDGLLMIRDKINFVLRSLANKTVKARAMSLLSTVKSLNKKIDDALKVFDGIEKKIGVPKNGDEANALELAISQIKQIVKTVHDPTVASRAAEIIGKIEKLLNSYKFQNQMKKIEEALSNTSELLAMAKTKQEVDDERERLKKIEKSVKSMKSRTPVQKNKVSKMLHKIKGIKRTIPAKTLDLASKQDVRELMRILNGFQEAVMPEIQQKLAKVEKSSALLSKFNRTNLDGLKDRIRIVSKDHVRITSGLESIKGALKLLGLHESDYEATLKFKNFDDTVNRMFELERLQEDPATNDLLKKAFTMVQEVLHANDTLKQLQRMIIFNTKLLNSNDKGQTMTEDTKPAPVPVTRVSLLPLIPGDDVDDESKVPKVENTATEASDLDKAVESASL